MNNFAIFLYSDTYTSDRRIKDNIEDLLKSESLKYKKYNWKEFNIQNIVKDIETSKNIYDNIMLVSYFNAFSMQNFDIKAIKYLSMQYPNLKTVLFGDNVKDNLEFDGVKNLSVILPDDKSYEYVDNKNVNFKKYKADLNSGIGKKKIEEFSSWFERRNEVISDDIRFLLMSGADVFFVNNKVETKERYISSFNDGHKLEIQLENQDNLDKIVSGICNNDNDLIINFSNTYGWDSVSDRYKEGLEDRDPRVRKYFNELVDKFTKQMKTKEQLNDKIVVRYFVDLIRTNMKPQRYLYFIFNNDVYVLQKNQTKISSLNADYIIRTIDSEIIENRKAIIGNDYRESYYYLLSQAVKMQSNIHLENDLAKSLPDVIELGAKPKNINSDYFEFKHDGIEVNDRLKYAKENNLKLSTKSMTFKKLINDINKENMNRTNMNKKLLDDILPNVNGNLR